MRGVVAVSVALLVSLMSSGCFVAEDDPETQDGETTGTGTSSATRTSTTSRSGTSTSSTTGNAVANQAPTASLAATPLNGTAPLNVTFEVGGADADSANLSWSLTLGTTLLANGTALPANFTQAFGVGNHTVILVVSDGANNATANVTIQVAAGSAGAVSPPAEDTLCPTDGDAIAIPGAGLYLTPMDSAEDPPFSVGSLWVYEESNGMPGLQRNDDTRPTDCPTPDTIIF
jgi:hypothetical protein